MRKTRKPRAAEFQIAARIGAALAGVNGAIDFDDELAAGSAEVGDELSRDGDLAAERDAELAILERGPKSSFRVGEGRAMPLSEELEPDELSLSFAAQETFTANLVGNGEATITRRCHSVRSLSPPSPSQSPSQSPCHPSAARDLRVIPNSCDDIAAVKSIRESIHMTGP